MSYSSLRLKPLDFNDLWVCRVHESQSISRLGRSLICRFKPATCSTSCSKLQGVQQEDTEWHHEEGGEIEIMLTPSWKQSFLYLSFGMRLALMAENNETQTVFSDSSKAFERQHHFAPVLHGKKETAKLQLHSMTQHWKFSGSQNLPLKVNLKSYLDLSSHFKSSRHHLVPGHWRHLSERNPLTKILMFLGVDPLPRDTSGKSWNANLQDVCQPWLLLSD